MSEKHFIIIGAPKAGTSFLFENLSSHPEINASSKKETRFFQNINFGKPVGSIEEYEAYFKNQSSGKWNLEASPGYLYGAPEICKVINEYLGSVNYLVILRNPVNRFISYYEHLRKRMLIESKTIDEFAEQSFKRYEELKDDRFKLESDYFARCLRAGFYRQYLDVWFELIDSEKIKVVFFDDLKSSSESLFKGICEWIGISPDYYNDREFQVSNESFVYRLKIVHSMALWFSQKVSFFLPKGVRVWLRKIYSLINSGSSSEMSPEVRKKLHKIYFQNNKGLSNLLKQQGYQNLPEWVKSYN